MLNNYLFYSLQKFTLRLEKSNNKERIKEIFEGGIKCYTSFFPTTKVVMNIENRKMVIYNKGRLYMSTEPLQLFYCIIKKENEYSYNYVLLNLKNEFQMEINLAQNSDDKFRYLFQNHFIFTDFDKKYEKVEFLNHGIYVRNFKVQSLVQDQLSKKTFYAKFYEKRLIQQKFLLTQLLETIQYYVILEDFHHVLKPFNYFEDQDHFVIVFFLPVMTSLKTFMEINLEVMNNSVVLQFLRNMIWAFIQFQKYGIYLPTVDPDSVSITLHHMNKNYFNN